MAVDSGFKDACGCVAPAWFGVCGSGPGVSVRRFRGWDLLLADDRFARVLVLARLQAPDPGFLIEGFGFRVSRFGPGMQGVGCGCRVWGVGCRL